MTTFDPNKHGYGIVWHLLHNGIGISDNNVTNLDSNIPDDYNAYSSAEIAEIVFKQRYGKITDFLQVCKDQDLPISNLMYFTIKITSPDIIAGEYHAEVYISVDPICEGDSD
jgi:hypothetical protein